VIVFGERHLRRLLNSYQRYYNEARTHLSLHKGAPVPRLADRVGEEVLSTLDPPLFLYARYPT
jgi:hypothetical protein